MVIPSQGAQAVGTPFFKGCNRFSSGLPKTGFKGQGKGPVMLVQNVSDRFQKGKRFFL